MKSLTGKNLTFKTLVPKGFATIDGQAANVIDVPAIQAEVHKAFYPPAAPAPSPDKSATGKTGAGTSSGTLSRSATTVDVYNGGNASGLAGQLSRALTAAGYKAGKVAAAPIQSSTEVLYGTGAAANAAKIAGYFTGVTANASDTVAAGHVEVLLGTDATSVPASIAAAASSPASSSSSSPVRPKPSPSQSGVVTVQPNAPYGIPCVN